MEQESGPLWAGAIIGSGLILIAWAMLRVAVAIEALRDQLREPVDVALARDDPNEERKDG